MSDPTKEQIEIVLKYAEAWQDDEGAALRVLRDAYEERGKEIERWRDRFRALVGADQPDSAGNAVITLQAEIERLRADLDNEHEAAQFWQTKGERAERLADEVEQAEARLREALEEATPQDVMMRAQNIACENEILQARLVKVEVIVRDWWRKWNFDYTATVDEPLTELLDSIAAAQPEEKP